MTSPLERSVDMSVTSRLASPPPPPVLSRTGSGLAAEEAAAGPGSTEREKPRGLRPTHQVFTSDTCIYGTSTPNPSGIYLTHLYLWYVYTQPIRYLPQTPVSMVRLHPTPSGIYLRHLYLWYVHTQPSRCMYLYLSNPVFTSVINVSFTWIYLNWICFWTVCPVGTGVSLTAPGSMGVQAGPDPAPPSPIPPEPSENIRSVPHTRPITW